MKRALFSWVLAGLALSISGCATPFQTPESYDGSWQGTWTLSNDSAAGGLSMELDHTGDHVSGTVEIDGTFCIGSAPVDAEVDAGGLSGSFSNGFGRVAIDASVEDATDELRGTFTVETGLCAGNHGDFVMHRR